eukprot:TRINITY_DN8153_c0_g1_i1.p1 TRINITY_DN8153_c0_g1~~TRINITY_DN8153_c0_g1_i1.p1  ORF type:complete len:621 (+),score=124.66 TRINITY_DN8153_c0_g1_i1:452-2314(+)
MDERRSAELVQRLRQLGGEDTSLNLESFRALWIVVMPHRTQWIETETLFDEIDTDQSGSIEFDELVEYVERWGRRREDDHRPVRPTKLKEWCWLFVGTSKETVAVDAEGNTLWVLSQAMPVFRIVSQLIVVLSVVVLMIESTPEMQNADGVAGSDATFAIEAFCFSFFTVEFLLYTWSYPKGWCTYIHDKTTWIDIVTIAPFFSSIVLGETGYSEASALRITTLVRLLRALRALHALRAGSGRVSKVPQLLKVLRKSAVALFWLLILIVISTVLSASVLFYSEKNEAHFDMSKRQWIRSNTSSYSDAGKPIHFQSIPDYFWWAVSAVAIGDQTYDEFTPVTTQGKAVGCVTMLGSLVIVSLPISIVMEVFNSMRRQQQHEIEHRGLCAEFHRGLLKWLDTDQHRARSLSPDGGRKSVPEALADSGLRRSPTFRRRLAKEESKVSVQFSEPPPWVAAIPQLVADSIQSALRSASAVDQTLNAAPALPNRSLSDVISRLIQENGYDVVHDAVVSHGLSTLRSGSTAASSHVPAKSTDVNQGRILQPRPSGRGACASTLLSTDLESGIQSTVGHPLADSRITASHRSGLGASTCSVGSSTAAAPLPPASRGCRSGAGCMPLLR